MYIYIGRYSLLAIIHLLLPFECSLDRCLSRLCLRGGLLAGAARLPASIVAPGVTGIPCSIVDKAP